jgi:hypothetical protein
MESQKNGKKIVDLNIKGDKKLIDTKITYENISNEDINIINKHITPKEKKFWNKCPMNELSYRIKQFQDLIFKKSNFIKNIESSIQQNESLSSSSSNVNITQKFINKKVYMSPIEYFYYIKPNAIQGRLNYFIKTINNESSIGVEYVQRKSKRAFFLQNITYLSNNNEFLMKYNYAKREDDFKRKSNIYTTKIKIIHNFLKRPYIFRDYFLFDPKEKISLIFSHRNINNYFDEVAINTNEKKNNSVNEIVMNLPEHDSTFNLKLLYEKNYLYSKKFNNIETTYENNSLTKISSEIINSLNTLYSKNKIFLRKLFYINPFIQLQFNIETAFLLNVHNLYHNIRHKIQKNKYIKPKNDDYKIHEKLYSYNFKGILNPSKKCQFLGTNKTLHSYMLGNAFYSLFNNKIIFKKMPIFNIFEMQRDGFEISPYVHFNSLITIDKFNFSKIPKNFKDLLSVIDNDDNNTVRMSSGLGVNVISKLFSFEIVYTPYVKKNLTDIHSKFTVKFGID